MTVELAPVAERSASDGRYPVALSSESPVDRWYGAEILDHAPSSVNLKRAKRGLPLLDSHDSTRQIGRIEDITLGQDKTLRGMLRLGNHPDAAWIRQDIEAGIRTDMSIGYQIDTLELERADDKEGNTYRATKWTPLEGSLVAVPADPSVGVGRAKDGDARPVTLILPTPAAPEAEKERTMPDPTPAPAPAAPVVTGPSADEIRKEARAIAQLGREHGLEDKVDGWLERSLSRDQVAFEILNLKRDAKVDVPSPAGQIDFSASEEKEYNLARYISDTAAAIVSGSRMPDSLEREASKAIAQKLGRPSRGLYVPLNLRSIQMSGAQMAGVRAAVTGNTAGTSSLGGAGVQTTILSLIDLLRNNMLTRALGAQVIGGLTSTVSFPRQITANTFTWSGENPSSANTLTAATLDNVTLSPRTAMVSTAYSRQLLVQSSFDVNSFVLNDLAMVNAIGLDNAVINGIGSSNQPTGIRATSGITNTTLGTNGAIPAWADIVGMETSVATNNAAIGTLAYLATPGMRGKLKTVLKNTTSGAGYLWEGGVGTGEMNGYRAEASTQMLSNLTKGTNTTVCHSIIFGVWSEAMIGEFGGAADIIVDPYSLAGQNMIAVTSILMADVGVRHSKAFVKIDDALIA
jgi:HK97 family phage major capsid protein/HK97 family phage prohead protease